jgi:hypothetical protein
MKKTIKVTLLTIAVSCGFASGATVIHNEDTTNASVGGFLSSTGSLLSTGGVSIGYFPSGAPLDSVIQGLTVGTAYSSLVTLGYRDVRNVSGSSAAGTTPADFDWNFGGITGSNVTDISGTWSHAVGTEPAVPSGTQLYVFAFNAGTFLTGFAGSTEWAAIKDTANTSQTGTLGRNVRLFNADVNEVLVGTDAGANVNLAAVPEPTKALLSFGAVALLGFRRRR